MELGIFSLSLNVKDLEKSLEFYQKLGFEVIEGGHMNEAFKDTETTKWRILSHESVKVGLFQGMFDNTIMTFNPKDVLSIQADLKTRGVSFVKEADPNEEMKHAILTDPDGNQIMLDQH
jgi:predicted lactoylglutathione lyase